MTLISRKQFLDTSLALAGAAVGLKLLGCSDDTTPGKDSGAGADGSTADQGTGADSGPSSDGSAGNCLANGATPTIGTNHGHTMSLPKADIAAGVTKTYDIQGTSAHPHSVTVTAADFAKLQNNQSVTLTSTRDDNHTHSVTLVCA
jgi:hypothetical protein